MEEAPIDLVRDTDCDAPRDPAHVSDTPGTATPQEEQARMLDIHPAHHAASSWREFFIHIATIVLGLLIAVGLEQTVEYIHHRHQAHQMEQALLDESIENRAIVQRDLNLVDQGIQVIGANMDRLNAAQASGSPFVPLEFGPTTALFAPTDTAWLTLRGNGLLTLVPQRVADSYWKVDYMCDKAITGLSELYDARVRVNAIIHLHRDPSQLSEQERRDLLLAYSQLQQTLVRERSAIQAFNIGNEIAIAGGDMTPDNFRRLAGRLDPD